MKKFKVFSVLALVALMLATSIGSVSASWTQDYNGAIGVCNNGENVENGVTPYPATIRITYNDWGQRESWKVVGGYYTFITSDPATIPTYVHYVVAYPDPYSTWTLWSRT